ncbi:ATP-binding protein [Photobacterium sp. MCCC 1A19761]|uniref:ATP-binding protein n=1 Tax=Photobacterium sp. MCCC 1A19761 TaxID=3115000 RepID=UPI00307F9368
MKTANTPVPFSIKKRLILTTVGVASIMVLISWVLVFIETRHEIEEVYDARLGQSAKILALSMPSLMKDAQEANAAIYTHWSQRIKQLATDDDSATTFGHPYEQNLMFQLFHDQSVLVKSPEAPDVPIGEPTQPGFGLVTIQGESWRRFQLRMPEQPGLAKNSFLVVAERQSIREELVNEIATSTGLPQLLLIPALALAIIWLINKLLEPIHELRQAVAQRNINKLDSILVPHPTVELSPLVNQLNYLLNELDKAWQRERRLTRTAAHELKTPLAVLRLNAENALASDNPAQLKSDLQQILHGIDRTDRLIQQLLMLSRVEAQQDISLAPIDLMENLREVIANLAPLALKQQQELALSGPELLELPGNAMLLSVLFSNLIDNAIRYSGAASSIDIEVVPAPEGTPFHEIRIRDNGPAIPEAVRDKIFEKFFRAHTERGDGAGLGMSIVDDIAKLHHGEVALLPNNTPRGNIFRVRLPAGNHLVTARSRQLIGES